MLDPIDNFLNNITMYKLVYYGLMILLGIAVIMSFFGLLPFGGLSLIFSIGFILIVSYLTNIIFAEAFNVQTNTESFFITAFILALIVKPPQTLPDLFFVFWVSVLAISSKFIFAINKKHIFNPAALAIFLTATFISKSANWWVGSIYMLLPVSILGFLVVKKIRRWGLVIPFLLAALGLTIWHGTRAITDTPLIFFATIMLTEPLTTPPTQTLRAIYGILTGILFAPQFHIGSFFTTPEIALLIGNVFSYIVSPKERLILSLKEKIRLTPDIYDFVFNLTQKFNFTPGQYMEFTLGHPGPDARGVRRYFTLSNSPTEGEIRVGIKFEPNGSTFKRNMFSMNPGSVISAGQLTGDLTLPSDKSKRLVFLAGGIGVTPFRSMIKYLVDTNEARPITLIYSDKTPENFVYGDVFAQAHQKLGIKVIYNPTQTQGHLTPQRIIENVADYKNSTYYLSGSHLVVEGFKQTLRSIGVPLSQIKLDYFPGFT